MILLCAKRCTTWPSPTRPTWQAVRWAGWEAGLRRCGVSQGERWQFQSKHGSRGCGVLVRRMEGGVGWEMEGPVWRTLLPESHA